MESVFVPPYNSQIVKVKFLPLFRSMFLSSPELPVRTLKVKDKRKNSLERHDRRKVTENALFGLSPFFRQQPVFISKMFLFPDKGLLSAPNGKS